MQAAIRRTRVGAARRWLLCIALMLSAPTAEAQQVVSEPEPRGRFDGPQSVVSLRVGFGLPTGLAGATATFEPTSWFITELGVGQGVSGPQVSAGFGFRVPFASFMAINAVAEYSFGKTDATDLLDPFGNNDPHDAGWISLTFQPELRLGNDFVLRPQLGIAWMVAGNHNFFDHELFITGVSVGYRFEL